MISNWDNYFLNLAAGVKLKSSCSKLQVGAVITFDNKIIGTGYNGTPMGLPNCNEGGCVRCANPKKYPRNIGYEFCTCIHAEHNAILIVASIGGAPLTGATLYCTHRPCLNCLVAAYQSGIVKVVYETEFLPLKENEAYYVALTKYFTGGVHRSH